MDTMIKLRTDIGEFIMLLERDKLNKDDVSSMLSCKDEEGNEILKAKLIWGWTNLGTKEDILPL